MDEQNSFKKRRISGQKLFNDGERDVIAQTETPQTRKSLAQELRSLGVTAGITLEVHSSLSSFGWVCGGPVAVIQALMDVVTEAGTLIMPTQCYRCSDPAKWRNPSVPKAWLPEIRESLPAFDPQITPTQLMGQIPEVFRTWPGIVRSFHPTASFAAWGQHAQFITANHSLDHSLGEGSPLARIYELQGYVLLLGVSYNRCTSIHLAEYRADNRRPTTERYPLLEDGRRVWKTCQDIELDTSWFLDLAGEFESKYEDQGFIKTAFVGSALSRLFPQQLLVDCGVEWLNTWNPCQSE